MVPLTIPSSSLYVGALVIALAIRITRKHMIWFWMASLPGIVLHEISHWITALVSFGNPGPPHIIPKKIGPGYWALGHVDCSHVRWYNGWMIGLAPLLLIPLSVFIIKFDNSSTVNMGNLLPDIGRAFLAAECWTDALPSKPDLKIVAKSKWILAAILGFFCWKWL